MKDNLIEQARLHAEHVLMPRLTQIKDWQADKRDALRVRIARIRSGKGDNFSEVQSALDALEASQAEIERQECLAKTYRRAQLTAEDKLCRMTQSEKGWRKRCAYLEEKLAALGGSDEG